MLKTATIPLHQISCLCCWDSQDSQDSTVIVRIVQAITQLVVPSICRCWCRYIIQCLVVTMNPFVMQTQPIPAHSSPYQPRSRYRGHRYPDRSLLTTLGINWSTRKASRIGAEVNAAKIVFQMCFCSLALLLKTTRYPRI